MTDQQKVREDAFREWDAQDNGVVSRIKVWNAAWQAAVAHASSATVKEKLTVGSVVDREALATVRIRNGKAVAFGWEGPPSFPDGWHSLYSQPASSSDDARDAARYRALFRGPYPFCFDGQTYDSKHEADKAIDQALAAERGEGNG